MNRKDDNNKISWFAPWKWLPLFTLTGLIVFYITMMVLHGNGVVP